MKSSQIRNTFLEFFKSKQHQIVQGAPIVVKNDPSLMFINAGMNQFKDLFLGNTSIEYARIADTQKCLRVSGKHNDLEEVGQDTYHHTMFEMLGNWSFGDYFKKEAIAWAWELLTDVYKIDPALLYVTVFGGDKEDGLQPDNEALEYWKQYIGEDHILYGSKKDNFWEMGETGPCGPCSEIHIDIRTGEEKAKIPGRDLVNKDHPEVIEIWNLVFIEFQRMANGMLANLPQKHIDTGMGFERLSMVLQGVRSNYDTDIFKPLIGFVAEMANIEYGSDRQKDVALRVIADHLRAVAFAIADGQLPSNTGAGYVIRRILRRAVRYGYTFLGFEDAFMYKILPILVNQMKDVFPEIDQQQKLVSMVIKEEENAFLRTLSQGLKRFEQYMDTHKSQKIIDGNFAFELFDTFGFPIDLTQLLTREKGLEVDMKGFQKGLEAQKNRSRKAAEKTTDDWIVLIPEIKKTEFVGYTDLNCQARIVKYRKLIQKKKIFYELVLDRSPFYAESGGQAGDSGWLESDKERLIIVDTKKENNLWVHFVEKEPEYPEAIFEAKVDEKKRRFIANNHSATHLMHAALRKVLGQHVEQKGSLVDADHLRFDFSHFAKMSAEEIHAVEKMVNEKVRENIPCFIKDEVPIDEAKKMGAMALFGEKYGDKVRVVSFDTDYSVELCGGTHIHATGQIGYFKIISESGIAAGVRRIEAITADKAEAFIDEQLELLHNIKSQFKVQLNPLTAIQNLLKEHASFSKQIDQLQKDKAEHLAGSFMEQAEDLKGISFIAKEVNMDAVQAKNLIYQLRSMKPQVVVVLAIATKGKANLLVGISDELVESKGLHAGSIIKEITAFVKGGGGGQAVFAMAGGKDASGIPFALKAAREKVSEQI